MNAGNANAAAAATGLALLALPTALVAAWLGSAEDRLEEWKAAEGEESEVAVAQAAEEGYCSPKLKGVLRRVLTSCGLVGADGGSSRGCQPLEAKSVATMSGEDFNALFMPLAERAAIVQFDQDSADLDPADQALIDKVFAARGGASWFLVVSRSSPEGSVEVNRLISEARGKSVMQHLSSTFADPELEKEVGLLWLGEEFAQLDDEFCKWSRSGDADACSPKDLNRSAFLAWIDCRL